MPKFNWARANERRKRRGETREFVVTPAVAEEWFAGGKVTKIQYGPVSYTPNTFTGREERIEEWLARNRGHYVMDGFAEDIAAMRSDQPKRPRPQGRCHGCHSSEFDATGKCVYCRQYRSA